jgi:chromate transporter
MLRLGFTAFGGPAAHVAMLRDEVVERRGWVTEQEFLDLLGASGLIPGPTSTQMAIHLGMARAGVPGLWTAGFCFITPAVLITTLIAWAYVRFGSLPAAQGLLGGVKPAVLAVVLVAVLSLGRSALKNLPLGLLAAAGLAAYVAGASEITVLLGCGAIGVLLAKPWRGRTLPPACVVWLSSPLTAAFGLGAPSAAGLFLYFLRIGCVLFGGGYVLLAFLRQGLVIDLRWLTERQLIDAIAVGQFTPGPVFSTAAFIGYVIAGPAGAAAASAGIFLPSFLLVWATHRAVRRMREAAWTGGLLDGVNAGSIALMAGVLWQLGHATLLGWPSWLLFATALVLALRWKVNSAWIVLGAALLGLVFQALETFR